MGDTFGSGLDFGGAGGASAGEGNPMSGGPTFSGGADVPPPITQPVPVPDTPVALTPGGAGVPEKSGGVFGSGLTWMPGYSTDPKATVLNQSADLLQQRATRASQMATNPLLQVFNPELVQQAREFLPTAAEQLQKIKAQKADMIANRQQAQNLGLAPGEVADEASIADRVEAARTKALAGDLKAFKGIQAVDPKTAEAIQDQVHETVAGHLTKAQYAFESLAGMQNQGQYAAKVLELRRSGALTDLEALGLKAPPTYDAFNAVKGTAGQALRQARVSVESTRTALEERNTYQPMEEKEAKTYNGRLTTAYGDQVTNGTWAANKAAGTRALIVNGAADPRDLGKSFTLATPEQRKAIAEDVKVAADPKDVEKFRGNNRLYGMATTTRDGKPIPSEGLSDGKGGKIYLNTNPNVQQGIAEGLAAALRGGSGGATSGLLNIETSKRGYIQSIIDKAVGSYGGAINTISGEQLKPYLTQATQSQMRDVLDYLHAYNKTDVDDRLNLIAKRAGALGLDASALGFGKHEAGPTLDAAMAEGKQAQIDRMMPHHQAIGGGDGVLQLGAQRPGANAIAPPAGVNGPTTQLPGAQPLQTPVQQSQNPQAPAPGPATGPGGAPPPTSAQPPAVPGSGQPGGGGPAAPVAPQPQTIAGQQVAVPVPPGISPSFVSSLQRIESGKSKDPWTAKSGNGPDGKPLSSASGAFQFIDSTWNDNKPAGAPAHAYEATPKQQTEAFATLIAKNAASLQQAGLPVNDTTLYVAHNLGAAGAGTLLNAAPDADARTVIGEKAARNNPLFFRGKPTVATVLDRYKSEMDKGLPASGDDTGPKPRPGAGGAEAPGLMTRISRLLSQGVPGDGAAKDKAVADVGNTAVEHAPAIGSTIGAVGGSALPGPGTIAGGAAGGAAGQVVKDYVQGRGQSGTRIAKEAALGGVLGIASEARPIVTAGARVLGSAAVHGGAAAAEGGDVDDIADAFVHGGAYGLGGEALGRFISAAGPVAHKVLTHYTPKAQAELSVQAGKLSEARQVLQTEQPKLAGESAGPNPKYEAAKKTEEEATQYIKDHNQKPDDMVYAYEQAKHGTSAGEALTLRKANAEKSDVGESYNQLRQDVAAAKPAEKNIKPNQAVPNGPLSTIRTPENPTGKVPEAFRADAEHAELLVKAPAKDWGAKWQQLQDAGTELIKKRMDFLTAGDKTSATAMNDIFQGVRAQQKAVATRLFGEKQGAEVISHLENLDQRYAKVMNATAGMNYQKMTKIVQGGNTPERRELEANFKEFAKDDPSAIRAFNAMKAGASGRMGEEAKLMIPVIAGEFAANASGVPTIGLISAAIGGHRLVKLMGEYMNAKLLGKPVTFKDFAVNAVKAYGHGGMNAAGSAAQRAVVQ